MNLSVEIAGVTLKNPIMTASGTFGSGQEYGEFVDLNSACCGNLRRHVKCHRSAESGH
jgi:dihydroorotate dehydrogenase